MLQVIAEINEYSYISFTVFFGTVVYILTVLNQYKTSTDIELLEHVFRQGKELHEIRINQDKMSNSLVEIKDLTHKIADKLIN